MGAALLEEGREMPPKRSNNRGKANGDSFLLQLILEEGMGEGEVDPCMPTLGF